MPEKSLQIGNIGEKKAEYFLIKNGYKVLKKNYHSIFGEIDIIATKGEYIIFAEVKARKVNSWVSPLQSVDKIKQGKIVKTALLFLSEFNLDLQPRFDVIEVTNIKDKGYIRHIKSAFDVENEYEIF